jgi:S-formylglutathione hydrolase FrmB
LFGREIVMSLTRRGFLGLGAGAAGFAAIGAGGWVAYQQHPSDLAAAPAVPAGILSDSFSSKHMKSSRVQFAISYPPGYGSGPHLPVILALYGRGDTYRTSLAPGELDLPRAQADVVAAGASPFAVVTVEAGPTSYWHDRADGRGVQTMIRTELLPVLAQRGLRTDRIGLLGWSMGGYGALLLAERLGSAGVAAVAAFAPALFDSYRHASPVAFDSAADFAANNVPGAVAKLSGIPIRIVCGKQDPFYAEVRRFVALKHDPAFVTTFGQGGHDFGYWHTETANQLQFLARSLV